MISITKKLSGVFVLLIVATLTVPMASASSKREMEQAAKQKESAQRSVIVRQDRQVNELVKANNIDAATRNQLLQNRAKINEMMARALEMKPGSSRNRKHAAIDSLQNEQERAIAKAMGLKPKKKGK